jgi:hypothetical protein
MTLEERLARLECRYQRLRMACCSLFAIMAVVLLTGAIDPNLPEILRAKRIQIIGGDDLDRVLVDIGPTASGHGGLVAFSHYGRPLIEMLPKADTTGWVTTYNQSGFPLVEMGATEKAEGAFDVSDGKGMRLVSLRPTRGGNGGLSTFTTRGFGMVELTASEKGVGEVKTMDGAGHDLVRLRATEDIEGTVTTYNTIGQEVFEIATSDAGAGEVTVYNGHGRALRQWPADAQGSEARIEYVMRAKAFEVVDLPGETVLARFGVYDRDAASLTTYAPAGTPRLKLGGGEQAKGLLVYDGEGSVADRWPR